MALTKVSTDGVKDDAINSNKIPANAVGASELADNAVDTNAIADQAVALSKLPHGTSSNDGKFLRANNGTDPSFETVSIPDADRIVEGNSYAEILDTGSNGVFRFLPEGAEKFRIDTDGNVGIGTSFPTTPDNSNADNPLNGSGTNGSPVLTIYGDSPAINLISSTTASGDYSLINFGRTGGSTNSYRAVIGYKQSDDILRINSNNIIAFDTGGDINANERMRIDSSGKVGIGKTNPVNNLDVVGSISATGNQLNTAYADGLYLGTVGGNAAITSGKANNSSYLPIVFRQDRQNAGIECMRILAGGGLTFNGDTAAANALDDYEEGTFTPAFANGLVASSYESNGQKGVYTKIGRYVYGTILLHLASTSTQNNNVIDIHGLPFTAGNNNTIGGQSGGAQYFYQDGFYNSNGFTGIVISNSTAIRLYRADTGAYLTGTSVNGGREIRVDFSYHAA